MKKFIFRCSGCRSLIRATGIFKGNCPKCDKPFTLKTTKTTKKKRSPKSTVISTIAVLFVINFVIFWLHSNSIFIGILIGLYMTAQITEPLLPYIIAYTM
ncbi:hypothetical protein [Candidatus Uabimicrobium amorphum]|uniref:Uncharacterized protein n=1 Tax=Uabimicrobium amorphum TaxID=2596890 RepID=A0A5S9IQC5_UABAM|nr:hypothetical protein [Candidatus Uabimicrobium amorphum]BBM86129.1 hypothetical protein UABAM_04515 [Candidatus Uabimicrobium amorphum]